MLDLYPVGQILNMPKAAYPTVLHNAFIDAGIPALRRRSVLRASWTQDDRAVRGRHDERPQGSWDR